MILTCPSCSASYNVSTDAIGLDGRTVRCRKCKHEWFQQGEKQALEDLINLVQATDLNLDELSFDDGKKKPKALAAKPKAKLSEKLSAVLGKIIPAPLKNLFISGDNRGFLSHFASFMVALAVFSCLVLVLVTGRWSITHVLPSLTGIYEAAGFPLTNYARLNPEESLIIDRVVFQAPEGKSGGKREITGSLINLTSQNIKVPTFKLAYLDAAGAVLQEGVQTLPIAVLQKELSYNFNLIVPEGVPQNFSAVTISFTE